MTMKSVVEIDQHAISPGPKNCHFFLMDRTNTGHDQQKAKMFIKRMRYQSTMGAHLPRYRLLGHKKLSFSESFASGK